MLEAVSGGSVAAVASELVLLELLVAPLKKGAQDVADEIEMALLHFPHLQLAPVTRGVLVSAAKIRAQYGLRTPDAIMVATAVDQGRRWPSRMMPRRRKVKELEVVVLRDLGV